MDHNGLHTFFDTIGYCMKDINDGHFQFLHHNINGEMIESWRWKIACASHISMFWSMQWCSINTRWKGGLIFSCCFITYDSNMPIAPHYWFGYHYISQCQNGLSNIKILVIMHSYYTFGGSWRHHKCILYKHYFLKSKIREVGREELFNHLNK